MNVSRKWAATASGVVAALSLAPLASSASAQETGKKENSRQTDKNNSRNLGIGLGAAAVLQAIRGKHTQALILGAGAAYAGKKSNDQQKAQNKNADAKATRVKMAKDVKQSDNDMGASSGTVAVAVDSDVVVFNDQGPEVVGGRVYVPLRGVLEKMGAEVQWDAVSRSITAQKGARVVVLPTGGQATVNGNPVALDAPAYIAGGRTMIPLRFMAEAFGADVNYDSAARQVSIKSQGKNSDTAGA